MKVTMTFVRYVLVVLLLWRMTDLVGWMSGKRNRELTGYVLDVFLRAIVGILLSQMMH